MRLKSILVLVTAFLLVSGCESVILDEVKRIINEDKSTKNVQVAKEVKGINRSNVKFRDVSDFITDMSKLDFEITKVNNDIYNQSVGDNSFSHMMEDNNYSEVDGILTFRGNNLRNTTSIGNLDQAPTSISLEWSTNTLYATSWGSGSGWTGQPLVVKWPEKTLKQLGVYEEYKEKDDFYEVIQVSLDGYIYFLDLETGQFTRDPIPLENPIKGTPMLDPRGYPLLVVGEGVPEGRSIGLSFINLITNKEIYKIQGIDDFAIRKWGAFDGSSLISRKTDTLVTNGENGLIYKVKLNSKFDIDNGVYDINPNIVKMRYQRQGEMPGVESSIIAFRNYVFTADNHGMIQAIDTDNLETLWAADSYDDTDSTMVLNKEGNKLYLYTASEIDLQGTVGEARIRKIDASNGEVVWFKDIPGYSILGSDPVNGGFLASPLLGEGDSSGEMIFTMARYGTINGGLIISLDIETGEELWRNEMDQYAWSSPIGTTDDEGIFYIVQADSIGNVYLLNSQGEEIDRVGIGYNIEASPVIIGNRVIVGSRGGNINSFLIE